MRPCRWCGDEPKPAPMTLVVEVDCEECGASSEALLSVKTGDRNSDLDIWFNPKNAPNSTQNT